MVFPQYGQMILREDHGCVPDTVPDGVGCLVEIPTPTDPNIFDSRSGANQMILVNTDIIGIITTTRTGGHNRMWGGIGERVLGMFLRID